jgi:hypothetical protein
VITVAQQQPFYQTNSLRDFHYTRCRNFSVAHSSR